MTNSFGKFLCGFGNEEVRSENVCAVFAMFTKPLNENGKGMKL